MKWSPPFVLGSVLLVMVTGAGVFWLPRSEAWTLLGSIAVAAAKMMGAG